MSSAEKIRKKQAKHCKECEEKTGRKTIEECFNCSFHKIMNENYEEALRRH